MNHWLVPSVRFAVAALLFLKALHPLSAEAVEPLAASAQSLLQAKLLTPLQESESKRSRFSRAVTPPAARRIRILEESPQTDRTGRRFVSFAVDETRSFGIEEEKGGSEDRWYRNAITGCVYPEAGDILVKLGDVYYPSSILLGRSTPTASADVCRPQAGS